MWFLGFLYIDYESEPWERIMWHNYYAHSENIDNLFLGSSHVYYDIDPYMMDKLNQGNNFNLSSGSQLLNGSYYLLKEVNKTHKLSHVYLELYYDVSTGNYGNYYDNYALNWRNTDYMRWSSNKMEYIYFMCKKEHYPETVLPLLRYRSKLFDTEYIADQITHKSEKEYKDYKYTIKNEATDEIKVEYRDKGYCYNAGECRLFDISLIWKKNKILDENPMTEDAELYLRRIIEFCRDEGIDITLFSSPVYELQMISVGNYDAYVKQIQKIAAEYGMNYYDFNLCKEEHFPIQSQENFFDIGHLNSVGAERFTAFLWKVTEENRVDYFYDSYLEKLKNSEEAFYGLVYSDDEEMRCYQIASNREKGMEYRIESLSEDGEDYICLQDYSENKEFQMNGNEHGVFRIAVRKTGDQDAFRTCEIPY